MSLKSLLAGNMWLCFLACCMMTAVPLVAQTAPDPMDLLSMTLSPPRIPYSGIVSIESGKGRRAQKLSVHFSPPDRYRRTFLEPDGREGRMVVKDGATLWVYDPARHKAWKGGAPDADDKVLGPEAEFELMAKNYEPKVTGEATVAGRSCWTVELRALREGAPSRTLCVDGRRGIVLETRTRRPDGSTAFAMRYESIDFPAQADPAASGFHPPEGTQVVESRMKPEFMGLEEVRREGGADPRLPGRLPAGYVFESADVLATKRGGILHIRFSDGITALSLFQCPKGARLALGGTPSRTMKLSSGRARLLYKDDDAVLEWHKDGLRFILVGRLTPERLRQVAESVP